jgi:SnoaL-like domain
MTHDASTIDGYAVDSDRIRAKLHDYCRYLDAFDLDGLLGKVFTEDVVDDRSDGARLSGHREVLGGHDDIRAYFTRAFESVEAIAHLLVNVDVHSIDGDRAVTSSRVLAFHWLRSTADLGPMRSTDFVMIGSYDDELRRTPDGWRIARRTVHMLGTGGLALGTFPAALG